MIYSLRTALEAFALALYVDNDPELRGIDWFQKIERKNVRRFRFGKPYRKSLIEIFRKVMDEYMIEELQNYNIGFLTCDRNGELSWWYPKKASHPRSPEIQQQVLEHIDAIIENLPSLGLELEH
ncbi:MAG: hypothetical protein ACTSU6_03695 [Candidatus Njordarchaeales archaeon]